MGWRGLYEARFTREISPRDFTRPARSGASDRTRRGRTVAVQMREGEGLRRRGARRKDLVSATCSLSTGL